jgi:hypothetical protein
MRKIKHDLTGKRFGKWMVLELRPRDPMKVSRSARWLCCCECGTQSEVTSASLLAGKSTQCQKCKRLDLVGRVFGNFTVLGLSYVDSHGKTIWECRCLCGKLSNVSGGNLMKGASRQCTDCGYRSIYGGIPSDYWCQIQKGAEYRIIEFKITPEYAWSLFEQQGRRCSLSGMLLNFEDRQKNKSLRTASIDRIDNFIGYVVGNIHWVHKHVNVMKLNHSVEYFIDLCRKVTEHHQQIL